MRSSHSTLSILIQEGSHRVITANPYPPSPLSPAELEKGGAGSRRKVPLSIRNGEGGLRG